jgi:uncharacterized protein (TIGR04255 family)
MSDEVKFEDPPVREVELGILFDPMEAVSVLDLAAFRVALQDTYPRVEEVAPLAPWESPDDESMTLLAGYSKWPMPMCILSNETRDTRVFFQNDRMGVSWTYGLDAPAYPGFSRVHAELERAYSQLLTSLNSAGLPFPTAKRVIIRYTNEIDGIDSGTMASGLLCGWPNETHSNAVSSWTTSLRMQQSSPHSGEDISLLVLIDPNETESEDLTEEFEQEPPTEFTPSAPAPSCIMRIGGNLDIDRQEDTIPALRRVHAVVLRKFLEDFASEEMIQKWGRL